MQQPGCLGCLLTLLCALLLGIEQEGAGPRAPEHLQLQSQPILPCPGELPQSISSALQSAKDLYWTPPLLPEKRFQGHNIDLQAIFSLFMFTGP